MTPTQCRAKSCCSRVIATKRSASGWAVRRDDKTGSSDSSSCFSSSATVRTNLEERGDEFIDRAKHIRIVGQCGSNGAGAGVARRDAARDKFAGMYKQARRCAFIEPAAFQVACHFREPDQAISKFRCNAGFGDDDFFLERGVRVGEFDRDEPLARALLQFLQHALITGVVRHREYE